MTQYVRQMWFHVCDCPDCETESQMKKSMQQAEDSAVIDGWLWLYKDEGYQVICPECAFKRNKDRDTV